MKLRLAKKILSHQDNNYSKHLLRDQPKFWGNYTGQQKLLASHRLFRYYSRHKKGKLALDALHLKPPESFQPEDQMDLKFERLIGQFGRGEPLIISTEEFIPPPEDRTKPIYSKNGQIHNFNAIPFPDMNYISYKHKRRIITDTDEDGNKYEKEILENQVIYGKPPTIKKDRKFITFKRYQARDNNTRSVPKYHV